jgi:rhodanese-related sulfurtransferase
MMNHSADIIATAHARTNGEAYAGAVTPQEAYQLLQSEPSVKLVDVRTHAERDWVGIVDIPSSQHLAVQWSLYPGGVPNREFLAQLEATDVSKNDVLLFLCRSGVRSRHAATLATESGFHRCFDILEGFEGDKDAQGHRKTVSGWCKANLPWKGA